MESFAKVLNVKFKRVIISTSRGMRDYESPGNPWQFESRENIMKDADLSPENYLIVEITGGDIQGLNTVTEITNKLTDNSVLWCELDVNWRDMIIKWLNKNMSDDLNTGRLQLLKVFFAPLSDHELQVRCLASGESWENVIEKEMLSRMISRRKAGLDNANDEKIISRPLKHVTL